MSLVKSLGIDAKYSERSLMSIRNISSPNTEFWGTPDFTLINCNFCPFKTIVFLSLECPLNIN